ncbi:MAG: amino acid ABC transporter permease [Treponema sp.]|nr:amino acid ABC transporter permease [Treponema sp.]MCI6892892.1 amino acid ABC transporter permease [Treponema sp.]MCI7566772.1 amino acid ABC transporter permease [Treponema sp.]
MSDRYIKMLLAMLNGSVTSLQVFLLTLFFSIPLALPIAMGRMSKNKVISVITNVFLLIIRGTPLMLQLLVVYFGPGLFVRWLVSQGFVVSFKWNRFVAAIVALAINYAAYFAEIYRGGIESIPKGQYEASKVLGYTSGQTFFRIILPQVIKRIVPAMGNEVITLVKDTALVSVIGVSELLMVAKERQGALFSFVPLFIAGVFYFVMNWIVSIGFQKLEKKLGYYN